MASKNILVPVALKSNLFVWVWGNIAITLYSIKGGIFCLHSYIFLTVKLYNLYIIIFLFLGAAQKMALFDEILSAKINIS